VFGINSGYEVAESLGVLGFVAMEEYKGGVEAARQFLSVMNITRALFVNTEKGNTALDTILQGFNDTLRNSLWTLYDNSTETLERNSSEALHNVSESILQVDQLYVTADEDGESDILSKLEAALKGCPYDAILLASSSALGPVVSALATNGCSLSESLLGTFDVSSTVYEAIAVGELLFAVSQQQYLQGVLGVVLASVYATTGQKLALSYESDSGVYFSGPSIVTLSNLPSDTAQICEADSYPVCPNTKTPDGVTESECPCIDRSRIAIGGVVHGLETSGFWSKPYSQAYQASADLGIELELDLLKPQVAGAEDG
jgi:ABC-type sugar transport system substrate-binding protein